MSLSVDLYTCCIYYMFMVQVSLLSLLCSILQSLVSVVMCVLCVLHAFHDLFLLLVLFVVVLLWVSLFSVCVCFVLVLLVRCTFTLCCRIIFRIPFRFIIHVRFLGSVCLFVVACPASVYVLAFVFLYLCMCLFLFILMFHAMLVWWFGVRFLSFPCVWIGFVACLCSCFLVGSFCSYSVMCSRCLVLFCFI